MYSGSAQGVVERVINVRYYYYYYFGSIRFPVEYYNIDKIILTASLKGMTISTILASSLSGIIERIILADSPRMGALLYG